MIQKIFVTLPPTLSGTHFQTINSLDCTASHQALLLPEYTPDEVLSLPKFNKPVTMQLFVLG